MSAGAELTRMLRFVSIEGLCLNAADGSAGDGVISPSSRVYGTASSPGGPVVGERVCWMKPEAVREHYSLKKRA